MCGSLENGISLWRLSSLRSVTLQSFDLGNGLKAEEVCACNWAGLSIILSKFQSSVRLKRIRFLEMFMHVLTHTWRFFSGKIVSHPFAALQYEIFSILCY